LQIILPECTSQIWNDGLVLITSTAETDDNLIGGEEGIGMGMPL